MSNVRVGTTTSNVNLREGPGTSHKILKLLPIRTTVSIVGETGQWLQVKAHNQNGFVHRDFVVSPTQKVARGFFIHHPSARDWPLTPTTRKTAPSDANPKTKQLAQIWNKYGGLLTVLSDKLRIDVATAASVVAVESSGSGFVNGRMLIRFENHYFWRYWGKDHPAKFNRHFSFAPDQPWREHKFRSYPAEAWKSFHGSQQNEWLVFEKAKSLNDEAAKSSISMGLPQIMGSNHKLIGYESASDMFESFNKDVRNQLIGLFDFIQGPETISRKVIALQNQDFVAFAELYNGTGQAPRYGGLLRLYFELFKLLN